MINIVVPMAGRGKRFSDAGFLLPKPLIDVAGKKMIDVVYNNVKPAINHQFIFIVLEEHIQKYNVDAFLKSLNPKNIVVSINHVTNGAAETVLAGKEFFNDNNELMIVNSDQFIDININDYINFSYIDGKIMTMYANDPKWSYVSLDDHNNVVQLKEKEVISSNATVGIYNFKRGKDFVKYAERMINKNLRVNNEFYVAPVYNEMILDKCKINTFNISSDLQAMYGLGTPEDLSLFLAKIPKRFYEKK
jgi:NDP-sugar pyrophosphorylase family protein